MSRKNSVRKQGKNRKLKEKEVTSLLKASPKGFGIKKVTRLLQAQEEFKALESRLKKWGGEIPYQKTTLPNIKKMSRQELNRYTRYLENAVNNPTVNVGGKFSLKLEQLEKNQREVANINRQIQKNYNRRQQLPLLEGGIQEELRGQKLTVDYLRYLKYGQEGTDLIKFQFNPSRFKNAEEYMNYFLDLQKKAEGGYVLNRDKQTIEGYIKAMHKQGFTGFAEGRELAEYLRSEDPSKIVDIIRSNRDASFDFLYGNAEIKGRLETLLEVFTRPE